MALLEKLKPLDGTIVKQLHKELKRFSLSDMVIRASATQDADYGRTSPSLTESDSRSNPPKICIRTEVIGKRCRKARAPYICSILNCKYNTKDHYYFLRHMNRHRLKGKTDLIA